MMRGTVYIEQRDGTLTKKVYQRDAETEQEFRAQVIAGILLTEPKGEEWEISFGPIGRPWGLPA